VPVVLLPIELLGLLLLLLCVLLSKLLWLCVLLLLSVSESELHSLS
jgi:hypothetical protein